MAPELALDVRALTAGYGAKAVVNEIDMRIAEQEIVGLVGANGAGKTTLMRALFGKIRVHGGRVRAFGRDITALPPRAQVGHGVAYVAQGAQVFPALTVRECLDVAAAGADGAAADVVVRLFPRLVDLARQRAGSLSGGERQMLAVGMALMQRPRIMFLDEPSAGLAPNLVTEMMRTVREVSSDLGLTVIVAEQNVKALLPVASRLYVLRVGRIADDVPVTRIGSDDDIRAMLL